MHDSSTVSECINKGAVQSLYQSGGVVGMTSLNSKVLNSYNVGSVTAIDAYNSGAAQCGGITGITARSGNSVEGCYSVGPLNAITNATGGVVRIIRMV